MKREILVVKITKEEFEQIKKYCPDARVVILNKQSSHKKRLVDNSDPALALLSKLRGHIVTSDEDNL